MLAKGALQEKKVYVRQFITGITILPGKEEGIVGFYAFGQVDDSLLLPKVGLAKTSGLQEKIRKSRASLNLLAEGGI
ncbi:MAG: hypothetical protein ACE5IT_02455 [bacterium]